MAKINPFHSVLQSVYHDNSSCTEGNNIEPRNRVDGKGGRRQCDHCARL